MSYERITDKRWRKLDDRQKCKNENCYYRCSECQIPKIYDRLAIIEDGIIAGTVEYVGRIDPYGKNF